MAEIKNAKRHGQPVPYHLLLLGVKKADKAPRQAIGYNHDGSIVYAPMQNFSATQNLR